MSAKDKQAIESEIKLETITGTDPLSQLLLGPVVPPAAPEPTTASKPPPKEEPIPTADKKPTVAAPLKTPILDSYFEQSNRRALDGYYSENYQEDNASQATTYQSELEPIKDPIPDPKKETPKPVDTPLPSRSKKREIQGLESEDVLEGEQQCINTRTSCVKEKVMCEGRLVMTNYKLVFIPDFKSVHSDWGLNPEFFKIPLGLISSVQKTVDKKLSSSICLDIMTKDFREIRLVFPSLEKDVMGEKVYQGIQVFAFPKDISLYFAFSHNPEFPLSDHNGWNIFQDLKEYRRMGIEFQATDCPFKLYIGNNNWEVANTYPKRLVVPKSMTDKDVEECSKFRTKERFPALTYFCKANGTSLWRSSQPKEGIWGNVSRGDQKMMHCIAATLPRTGPGKNTFSDPRKAEATLHILDARSKMAAFGNKITGSGYENSAHYPFTYIIFGDIANIHTVRESYHKLAAICNDIKTITSTRWHSALDKTDWFHHLVCILRSANLMAESMRAGKNVLVHCSDGWDRTSQLAALTQVILDKYYRTIEGFEVLIEKDFLAFGHQFGLRLGHATETALEDKEFCPVFIQFLDCVYQMLHQFPTLFEFNAKFLTNIAFHIFSLRFGTFIGNCEKDRKMLDVREKTTSLWTYMNSKENREKYINVMYKPDSPVVDERNFYPEPVLLRMKVWEELYMRWSVVASTEHATYVVKELQTKCEESEKELIKSKELLEKYKKALEEHGIDPEGIV